MDIHNHKDFDLTPWIDILRLAFLLELKSVNPLK